MAIAVNQKSTATDRSHKPPDDSYPANPLAVFPNRLQRGQIAAVENVAGGGSPLSLPQIIPGIAGVDGNELEHARIAVAIDSAAGAAVANQFRFVPFIHVADGCLPKVTAVKVQVPVEVEILVAAEAAELLRFLAQMPLHFAQRLGRVHDGITALFLHLLDLLKYLDEFAGPITDECGVAEAQVA